MMKPLSKLSFPLNVNPYVTVPIGFSLNLLNSGDALQTPPCYLDDVTRGPPVLAGVNASAPRQRVVCTFFDEAGGSFRTITRPTLNRRAESARLSEHEAFTLKVGHAPISLRVLVFNDPRARRPSNTVRTVVRRCPTPTLRWGLPDIGKPRHPPHVSEPSFLELNGIS